MDWAKHRDAVEKQRLGLTNLRTPFDRGNKLIAQATLPVLSGYVVRNQQGAVSRFHGETASDHLGYVNGGEPYLNDKMFNSTAPNAHRICSTGLAGGLSSSTQPWFKVQSADRDLRNRHEVKIWFDEVNEVLRLFLNQTNIYEEMQKGYGELTCFGSEATLFTRHWQYGAVAQNLTWGSYWFGADDGGRINRLMRDVPLTVEQLIRRIGSVEAAKARCSKAVVSLIEKEKYSALVPVRHMIQPNNDMVFGSAKAVDKPYSSIYWEAGECKAPDRRGVLSVSGFDRKPFATPRWNSYGSLPYGWGPALEALPEARKVQVQEVRYQAAIDYAVRPALNAPISGQGQQVNLMPAGVSYTAGADGNQTMKPVWEVNPSAINAVANDITNRTEEAIRRGFFVSLFQPITAGILGSQPRTAEEIARRHEESLSQIGPVTDRIQTEKLSVIVMQAFSICSEAGLLPPVPDELDGAEVSIEYTSMLSQAQRLIGLGNIERSLGFLGNLAGMYPAIMDRVDLDEALIEYWDRMGMSAKTLRNAEDVEAKRQADAQAAEQQRMAEMMPALNQGVQAASLLSETAGMGGGVAGALQGIGV